MHALETYINVVGMITLALGMTGVMIIIGVAFVLGVIAAYRSVRGLD